MDIQTNKGILYPENPTVEIKCSSEPVSLPAVIEVPHKAWAFAKADYDRAFSSISFCKPNHVFVLAPLHKGKVCFDDPVKVYTYSDCPIVHEILEKNDDICSEEFSFEVILPYIKAYFPNAERTAFFAPVKDVKILEFRKWLENKYPDSVFIESFNSENCPQYWK